MGKLHTPHKAPLCGSFYLFLNYLFLDIYSAIHSGTQSSIHSVPAQVLCRDNARFKPPFQAGLGKLFI